MALAEASSGARELSGHHHSRRQRGVERLPLSRCLVSPAMDLGDDGHEQTGRHNVVLHLDP
jgi:hypothetical protein